MNSRLIQYSVGYSLSFIFDTQIGIYVSVASLIFFKCGLNGGWNDNTRCQDLGCHLSWKLMWLSMWFMWHVISYILGNVYGLLFVDGGKCNLMWIKDYYGCWFWMTWCCHAFNQLGWRHLSRVTHNFTHIQRFKIS